jgi:hypothetical protein
MDICDKLESMITRTVSDDMTHHEAAQIIRSLREENRELQNELVSGIHTCGPKCRKTARCTEMADLRAELAECKDDAKRFIWLANELGLCIMTMNADPSFFAEDDGDAVTAWRKAIDAARKGEGE